MSGPCSMSGSGPVSGHLCMQARINLSDAFQENSDSIPVCTGDPSLFLEALKIRTERLSTCSIFLYKRNFNMGWGKETWIPLISSCLGILFLTPLKQDTDKHKASCKDLRNSWHQLFSRKKRDGPGLGLSFWLCPRLLEQVL